MSFNQKLPDSGNCESQGHHTCHGVWMTPAPFPKAAPSRVFAVINQSQANCELDTLPGLFCSASGPEPTQSREFSSYNPSGLGENSRSMWRGRGEGEHPCTSHHDHLFSTAERHGPPGLPSAHLTAAPGPTPPDAGGPKVTMSEVYWARGRTEMGSVPASEPSQSRLSLRREREGLLKDWLSRRVAGSRAPWDRAAPRLRRHLFASTLPSWRQDQGVAGSRDAAPGGWAETQLRGWCRQLRDCREGPP